MKRIKEYSLLAFAIVMLPGIPVALLISHVLRALFFWASWPGSEEESYFTIPIGAVLTYGYAGYLFFVGA